MRSRVLFFSVPGPFQILLPLPSGKGLRLLLGAISSPVRQDLTDAVDCLHRRSTSEPEFRGSFDMG